MIDGVNFVDFRDSIPIKVAEFLRSKGFDLADITGMEDNQLHRSRSSFCVGVLYRDPKAPPRTYLFDLAYLFGLVKRAPRRTFLGVLKFKERPDDSEIGRDWSFEMYGRANVEMVQWLAKELASTFDVGVTVYLEDELPRTETCLSDYDY